MINSDSNILKSFISAFAVLITSMTFADGPILQNPSRDYYVQLGTRLIQDESQNSNYDIANYGTSARGFHTMFGTWRPSFAIGVRDSFGIFSKRLAWDKSLGFQWASQDYWGRYTEPTAVPNNPFPILRSEYRNQVSKYYAFIRTSIDIPIFKNFSISPIVHCDYRFYTAIPSVPLELAQLGVYDFQNKKLLFHRDMIFKFGAQMGYRINEKFNVSLAYLHSINESILVEPGNPWKNTQRELNVSYTL